MSYGRFDAMIATSPVVMFGAQVWTPVPASTGHWNDGHGVRRNDDRRPGRTIAMRRWLFSLVQAGHQLWLRVAAYSVLGLIPRGSR